jgi:hypothetical protein
MKSNGEELKVAAGTATSSHSGGEGAILSFIERSRIVVLTSPLWLAAIMIGLYTYGGQRVHAVIGFLSGIAQR